MARARLRNQRLAGEPFGSAVETLAWFGAIQAQEYGYAKWSFGQRSVAVRDADLDRALADGAILRTHALRPTWHFVLPEDIRWIMTATAPRVHAFNAYYYRQAGVDEAATARAVRLMRAALRGGNRLTRKELSAIFEQDGIAPHPLRYGYLVMHAELELVICSGGLSGKQQTYALLDEVAPQSAGPEPTYDEALAELVVRYFTGHGPATVKDLAWWSSLTIGEIRRGLDLLGSALASLRVGEREYYCAAGGLPPVAEGPRAHLLQAYDEFGIGYSESRDVTDLAGLGNYLPTDRQFFQHGIVLDGQHVGRWRRTRTADAVAIEAQLLRPFDSADDAALRDAAVRYGDFVGVPATIEIRPLPD